MLSHMEVALLRWNVGIYARSTEVMSLLVSKNGLELSLTCCLPEVSVVFGFANSKNQGLSRHVKFWFLVSTVKLTMLASSFLPVNFGVTTIEM